MGGSQFFGGFERKEIKRKVTTRDQVLALEMILGLYENHCQIRVVNLEHTKIWNILYKGSFSKCSK